MKRPEKNQAEQLFEQYCYAYTQRNLQQVLSMFTRNSNLWGTGLDEYRTGLEEIKKQHERDWLQSEKGKIEIVSFVPTSQNAIWAAAICKAYIIIKAQEYIFEHLRGSIILDKEDGVWKIMHMHASFPDYRNALNSSFPTEQI